MQINKNTQLIEVIVSKYSDQSSTNAFIDKYLLKMHEQVSKLANYEMVGPNYEYMYIFAKKYHIRLIKGHKRKSYEIINNCIYFKINKTVDCFDLVKQIYQTQTQGFIKKRFAF
jgi:hypothetical protein